jgi:FkbM family methyltransferase
MRFYPSAISTGLWRDRNFRSEDACFIRDCLGPSETFVDVGANVGQLSLVACLAVGPAGKVIAVEPHPLISAYLRGNAQLNAMELEIHNVAVGSCRGAVSFTSFRSDDMNFVTRDRGDEPRLQIPMVTLDEIVAGREVHLLKVDVEGFEVECLKGASETLASCRCVYIEDCEANLQRAGASRAELYDRLLNHGFDLFHERECQLEAASVQTSTDRNLIAIRPSGLATILARTGLRLVRSEA